VQLSSFTTTVIILHPIIGSSWKFMWSLLTCGPTLVSNFRSIGVWKVNRGHTNFVIYFLFDLWTSYLVRILFLKGCGSLFWESPNSTKIFNGLQYSFQVWQGFINVSESFSYKDSLFILAKKKEKKISELILPSDLILLAYMGLLKGNKSDSIIFSILNSDLLLLLLFSS